MDVVAETPGLEAQAQYDAASDSPLRDPRPVPLRRRVLMVGVFIAMVFVLDRGIALALGRVAAASQFRYSVLYAGRGTADVLVVGNSRGVHSLYTPEMSQKLGVRVFNLSQNGTGMDVAAVVVGDYLDRNPPPKLILLEVTSVGVTPGETIGAFQPFLGESERVREAFRRHSPKKYWAAEVFNSYRYNGQQLEKILLYLRKDDQHWISSAERRLPQAFFDHVEELAPPTIHAEQIKHLRTLMANAEAHGVRVVPFVAPYLPASIVSSDMVAPYARALGNNAPAIRDYSGAVEVNEAFADRLHTNIVGARLLFERMVADGVFQGGAH